MTIDDERDLGAGLRALTAAQPPLSATLAERAARGRVVRRQRRLAWTAVAVAASVAATVAVARVVQAPVRPQPMAKALLRWPDARNPDWVAASEVALPEVEGLHEDRRPVGATVRWLYADKSPLSDDIVVAWAYCFENGCPRVVLAHARQRDALADDGEPDSTHWLSQSGDVPDDLRPYALSAYLRGPDSGHGPTNVVVAIVPPKTRSATWWSSTRLPATGGRGALVRYGAAYYGNVGYLSTDVLVDVDVDGKAWEDIVGVPGATEPVNGLPPNPPEVVVPAPYQRKFWTEGPAEGSGFIDESPNGQRVAVFAVCDDPGIQIVFVYREQEFPLVCDGVTRMVFDQPVVGHQARIGFKGGPHPYTALSWAAAYRS